MSISRQNSAKIKFLWILKSDAGVISCWFILLFNLRIIYTIQFLHPLYWLLTKICQLQIWRHSGLNISKWGFDFLSQSRKICRINASENRRILSFSFVWNRDPILIFEQIESINATFMKHNLLYNGTVWHKCNACLIFLLLIQKFFCTQGTIGRLCFTCKKTVILSGYLTYFIIFMK